MKHESTRQIIDKISQNNKVIALADELIEKMEEFNFEAENSKLFDAIQELENISFIHRTANLMLLVDFRQMQWRENRDKKPKKTV
jgi:hypothetical protein